VYAGVLPTDGSGNDTAARALVLEGLERAGLAATALRGVVVTPACGLAALTPEGARTVVRSALDTARRLGEEVGS
ncbi:MAG TPA: methionine synthase, partial [Ornithinibacter sp.]|nr:methionine synthase [Ornithinibacter sp.]